MISQTAKDLYFHAHDIPGWLPMLARFTGDREEDLHDFADRIDAIERNYYATYREMEDELFDLCLEATADNPDLLPKKIVSEGSVSEIEIQRAREFPITELIENKRMWAVCPFHSDREPSLYLKKNFYHCFACGVSGDTIKLTQHVYNVDFKTAVKMLQ